jgi:hypothetical protein
VKRRPVHNLDPAEGTDGQVPVIVGGKFVIGDAAATPGAVLLVHVTATDPSGDFVDVWTDEGDHLYVEASLA